MNELHLFAGTGGGILGGMLLGHTTVCAVEIEPYCRKVLLQRQRDGMLPKFPIWDDVRTFDGKPWRGKIDCICGGFPCQDISCAGKGAGLDGERSGLWREFARIIGEVRPKYAFVENSPMLALRGLGRVLGDLSEMGYDATWCVLGASDVGAPHIRKRMWILAHARHFGGRDGKSRDIGRTCQRELEEAERANKTVASSRPSERASAVSDADSMRAEQPQGRIEDIGRRIGNGSIWWRVDPAEERGAFESQLGRVAHGVAHRVDRLKAIGNGQVPLVAASAFRFLIQTL